MVELLSVVDGLIEDKLDVVAVTIELLELPVALAETLLLEELPVALTEELFILKDVVELAPVLLQLLLKLPLDTDDDTVAEIDDTDDTETLGQAVPVVTTAVSVVVAVFVTI